MVATNVAEVGEVALCAACCRQTSSASAAVSA
jgi:hypothetical protein